jgi:hypothetical protein
VFGRAVEGGGYDARYAAEGGLAAVNIGIAFRKVTGILTYDDAHTRTLSLTQALPYRKSGQLNGVVDVDVDLLVSLVLLGIVPEIGEGWVEYSGADSVGVGYVVPFLLACVEDLGEVRPLSHVCLHIDDMVFACSESVELGRRFEVSDEYLCAGIVSLFGECEADAYCCELSL